MTIMMITIDLVEIIQMMMTHTEDIQMTTHGGDTQRKTLVEGLQMMIHMILEGGIQMMTLGEDTQRMTLEGDILMMIQDEGLQMKIHMMILVEGIQTMIHIGDLKMMILIEDIQMMPLEGGILTTILGEGLQTTIHIMSLGEDILMMIPMTPHDVIVPLLRTLMIVILVLEKAPVHHWDKRLEIEPESRRHLPLDSEVHLIDVLLLLRLLRISSVLLPILLPLQLGQGLLLLGGLLYNLILMSRLLFNLPDKSRDQELLQ